MWILLLLAGAVRSFAHVPLGINDLNSRNVLNSWLPRFLAVLFIRIWRKVLPNKIASWIVQIFLRLFPVPKFVSDKQKWNEPRYLSNKYTQSAKSRENSQGVQQAISASDAWKFSESYCKYAFNSAN